MCNILERSTKFFDGHVLLSDRVVCGTHDALGSRPDRFEVLVSLEDGEPCVSNLNSVKMRGFY